MGNKDYLGFIVNEIHSTVIATVDENRLPVTCAIDIMDYDDESLYFLTAKGKSFYERLKNKPNIALTGMKGEDTLSCIAVSIRGKVREIGSDMLSVLFDKNPYMNEIYPDEKSRTALTVFQIYDGTGEWFDLSKKPIERDNFCFGNTNINTDGYYVNDECIGCKLCYSLCPQKCIDITVKPVIIKKEHCLHCGNCYKICPKKAVIKL